MIRWILLLLLAILATFLVAEYNDLTKKKKERWFFSQEDRKSKWELLEAADKPDKPQEAGGGEETLILGPMSADHSESTVRKQHVMKKSLYSAHCLLCVQSYIIPDSYY